VGVFLLSMLATPGVAVGDDKDDRTTNINCCIQQGNDAKEFVLTATDGSTWEVRSDKVTLAERAGHTVTATSATTNQTTGTDRFTRGASERYSFPNSAPTSKIGGLI
jgi:hypothetical protein